MAFEPGATDLEAVRGAFAPLAKGFAMKWSLRDTADRLKVMLLVSKFDHCLGDLLYRKAVALKPGEVSDPVVTADGPHLLYVSKNLTPVATAFEESRLQVLTDFKQDMQKRMQANEDKFLRDRADILIAKAFQ